jgi:hypothetical protein
LPNASPSCPPPLPRAQGDSPTPSCPLSLPGVPYNEGVSLGAAAAAAGAAEPAPCRWRQRGPAEPVAAASCAARPAAADADADAAGVPPDASPVGSDGRPLLQAASPGGRLLRTRLSWLIEQNQQELRNLLEWQQEQQEQERQRLAQASEQQEGEAAGARGPRAATAQASKLKAGAPQAGEPQRGEAQGKDQDAAGAESLGGGSASVNAVAPLAGGASGSRERVLSALQRAGVSPGSPPWPLSGPAAALGGANGASDAPSVGRRGQRRRQRTSSAKGHGEGDARPAAARPLARRASRDVDESPDCRSASDGELAAGCEPAELQAAPTVSCHTRTQPTESSGAAGGGSAAAVAAAPAAGGSRPWLLGPGRAAGAHAAVAPAHRASRLAKAAAPGLDGAAAAAAAAAEAGGDDDRHSAGSEGEEAAVGGTHEQAAALAAAPRRVRMRCEFPALPRGHARGSRSGAGPAGSGEGFEAGGSGPPPPLRRRSSQQGDGGPSAVPQQQTRGGSSGPGSGSASGGVTRRATTRAAATQTPVHEGTQTEPPAVVWRQAGFEQTPVGQGVNAALPGAPVQPPPPPFQQQQQQHATPAAAAAAIAAHQIGAAAGAPPHAPGLQPTPLVGGGAGQAAAHVVRSLFMGPATPAPLLVAQPARAPRSRAELMTSTPLPPPAALGAAIGMATAAAALSAAAAATAFMASPAVSRTPPVPRTRAAPHDGAAAAGPAAAGAPHAPPAAGTPAPTPGARTPAFGYAPPSGAAGSPATVPEPLPWPQMRGAGRRSPDAGGRHFSPMSAYGKYAGAAGGGGSGGCGSSSGPTAAPAPAAAVAPDRTPAVGRITSGLSPLGARSAAPAAGSPAVWAKQGGGPGAAAAGGARGLGGPSRTPLRPVLNPQPSAAVAAAALAAAAAGPATIPERCLPPSAQHAGAQGPPQRTPLRECQAGPSDARRDGEGVRAPQQQAAKQQRRPRAEPSSPEGAPALDGSGADPGASHDRGSPAPRGDASEQSKRPRKSSRAARPQPEMLRRYLASADD